jgi:hypothetical protein
MSYSFQISGGDKLIAKQLVAQQLDAVVKAQPIHEVDKNAAYAAAYEFIDLLPDDETKVVQVTMNGSISWTGEGREVTAVAIAISAYLTTPAKAELAA